MIKLIELPATGYLIEWGFVSFVVIVYVIFGIQFDLFQKLNCSFCEFGIVFWSIFYIVAVISAAVCRFASDVDDPEFLRRSSLLHVLYHIVRWPILFACTFGNDPIIMLGLFMDYAVLGLGLVIYGLYKFVKHYSRMVRAELK